MHKSVRTRLLNVSEISSIDKPFQTIDSGKLFVVTNKTCKEQVRREVEKILIGPTFKINHSEYNNQPGTKTQANRKPTFTSYAVDLQKKTNSGPAIANPPIPDN